MRAWRLVGPVFITQHHAAWLTFASEDQIRQVCHWSPRSINYTLLSHTMSCSENPANWISLWFQCFTYIFRLNLNPALSGLILISIDCYVILCSTNYTIMLRFSTWMICSSRSDVRLKCSLNFFEQCISLSLYKSKKSLSVCLCVSVYVCVCLWVCVSLFHISLPIRIRLT